MIAPNIATFLETLDASKGGLTLEQVLQQVRELSRPTDCSAVLRQCSLARSFNRELFELLCGELPGTPLFDDFVRDASGGDRATADLLSDGNGWWRVAEMTREHYLKEWTSNLEDWKRWNQRLVEYFLAQPGPYARVHVLYHLAVADPDRALELFPKWFKEADEAFDLAQCNALLEVLRVQENWRGSKLSAAWQAHRQHYLARSLFLQDYYKTGAYLLREGPLAAFRHVLARNQTNPWIFHIHATGGIGKTMFLRWLISRELIPAKIPCARVDFDDFKTVAEVVNAPLRMMVRIVEQLDQQLPRASLTSLLERLQREQDMPGWNTSVLSELQRHFRGARIETPVVIVLDTLEEPTLSHARWLTESIGQFREFRKAIPQLVLVLSGRYNVVERIPELDDAEYLHYELTAFTQSEAEQFLRQRGIPDAAVREAMIRKIGGQPFSGANPFMLALLAELALNRKQVTASTIDKLPRVDFAYLIERIVLRIESQPLRWVIRYGAVARDLTPDFVGKVLLAPLRAALTGNQRGDRPRHSTAEALEQYADVWVPDAQAATRLDAGQLWEDLAKFARERGWISLVDGKTQIARFHPEVIIPTRDLLRNQPIFRDLQRRAIRYFAEVADNAPDHQAWAAASCEILFHRFQLEGPGAASHWQRKLERARRRSVDAAIRVAHEVIGRDYAEGEVKPLAWGEPPSTIILPETLAQAHCAIAGLMLERAGVTFFADAPEAKEFQRHVELAQAIASGLPEGAIPECLSSLGAALGETNPAAALETLSKVRPQTVREHFLLEVQLAELSARLRRADTADHYHRALDLWASAGVTTIQPHQLLLRLADWHQFTGDYAATMKALRGARKLKNTPREAVATVLHREAACALSANDLPEAEDRVRALWATVGSREGYHGKQVLLLEAQVALEKDDLLGVGRRCEQLLPGTEAPPAQTAQVYDLLGRAATRRFEFNEAFDHWERSSKLYDDARIVTGSSRCAILRIRTMALLQGRMREAESTLRHAFSLPGARDVEVYAELELLQAFIAWKSGRPDDAGPRIKALLSEKATEWPARLTARMMFWACATGWHARCPDYLEQMLAAIRGIQPPAARYRLLDILEHAGEPFEVNPGQRQQLLELFPRPPRNSAGFVESEVGRARLLFMSGDSRAARKELEAARAQAGREDVLEARFLKLWKINIAALQMGSPSDFLVMADSAAGLLDTSPLMGCVKLEAAIEAIRLGQLPRAELLLVWAHNRLSSESSYTVWNGRLDEARSALNEALGREREAADHLESAARLYDQLGAHQDAARVRELAETRAQSKLEAPAPRAAPAPAAAAPAPSPALPEPPQSPGARIILAATTLPSMAPVKSLLELASMPRDLVLDHLLERWPDFAELLDRALLEARAAQERSPAGLKIEPLRLTPVPDSPLGSQVALEIEPGPLAALPWEIAPSLRQCQVLSRVQFQRSPRFLSCEMRPEHREAVRLLLPHAHESRRESNSYQGKAGVDLERLYYFAANTVPAVSYAPTPEQLLGELSGRPCAVLHIVAAVREFSGGIFLDFESTEGRIEQRRGEEHSFLTPTYLDRVLASLKQPPFVILDIAHPDNDAETVRRLLLRNTFADHLFQLGNTCGVLAAGLVDRFNQEFTAGPLIREVMNGAPMAQVLRLVRANQQSTSPYYPLASELPSLGAALFSDHPDVSPFAPGPPHA